jgi:hypothetical protein
VTRRDQPPNLWGNRTVDPRRPGSGSQFGFPTYKKRSGFLSLLKTLLILGILGVGGYYGWQYAKPYWAKFRTSADVEHSARLIIQKIPAKWGNEAELGGYLQSETHDRLGGMAGLKARWYVCYGPRGEEVRVVRDDHFDKSEKQFVERYVDEGRLKLDVEGAQHDVFTYPLGAVYTTVSVGGTPWCVVVGWSENVK